MENIRVLLGWVPVLLAPANAREALEETLRLLDVRHWYNEADCALYIEPPLLQKRVAIIQAYVGADPAAEALSERLQAAGADVWLGQSGAVPPDDGWDVTLLLGAAPQAPAQVRGNYKARRGGLWQAANQALARLGVPTHARWMFGYLPPPAVREALRKGAMSLALDLTPATWQELDVKSFARKLLRCLARTYARPELLRLVDGWALGQRPAPPLVAVTLGRPIRTPAAEGGANGAARILSAEGATLPAAPPTRPAPGPTDVAPPPMLPGISQPSPSLMQTSSKPAPRAPQVISETNWPEATPVEVPTRMAPIFTLAEPARMAPAIALAEPRPPVTFSAPEAVQPAPSLAFPSAASLPPAPEPTPVPTPEPAPVPTPQPKSDTLLRVPLLQATSSPPQMPWWAVGSAQAHQFVPEQPLPALPARASAPPPPLPLTLPAPPQPAAHRSIAELVPFTPAAVASPGGAAQEARRWEETVIPVRSVSVTRHVRVTAIRPHNALPEQPRKA